MTPDVFTPNELADYLRISLKTLERWEKKKIKPFVPSRTRLGHRRYLKSEIQNYFFGEK